ncbi:Uncharacterised protein [Vibrio cholerae]|nr:Uncharacterised protein [Vibrio cholerae]
MLDSFYVGANVFSKQHLPCIPTCKFVTSMHHQENQLFITVGVFQFHRRRKLTQQ